MSVRAILAKVSHLGVLVAAVCVASCGSLRPCFTNCHDPLPAKYQPDPAGPSTVISVMPTSPWTETAVTVRKGERLLFTATGDVLWERSNSTTGPDGYKGVVGWSIGRGGLIGKIGENGKAFDIGARAGLFPDQHARPPHHPYPPPPIKMPRDGKLYLGFNEFAAGANTGMLNVTISRAVRISP